MKFSAALSEIRGCLALLSLVLAAANDRFPPFVSRNEPIPSLCLGQLVSGTFRVGFDGF